MSKIRISKINAEMARSLSAIINSRLKNVDFTSMISVMRVEVSNDFSHAKVYVSVFGDAEVQKHNLELLRDNKSAIKKELAAMMKSLHHLPDVHFLLDDSLEYSDRINKLLNEIKKDES